MKRIGLTGGIASGKSTVTNMLRARGAAIVDADVIAREVVAPGTPGLHEVAARFPSVMTADGALDRQALGALVFSDPKARADLNAITHPRIAARVIEQTVRHEAAGEPFCIYDSPLLIENELHRQCDAVVLVFVDRETQLARLMSRNHLSREQAMQRIEAQMPLEKKRQWAKWVIDNSGSIDATQKQVDALWPQLSEEHP